MKPGEHCVVQKICCMCSLALIMFGLLELVIAVPWSPTDGEVQLRQKILKRRSSRGPKQ